MTTRRSGTLIGIVLLCVGLACTQEETPRVKPEPPADVRLVGATAVEVAPDGTIYVAGPATTGDPPVPVGESDGLPDAVVARVSRGGDLEVFAGGGTRGELAAEWATELSLPLGIEAIAARDGDVVIARRREQSVLRITRDGRSGRVAAGIELPKRGRSLSQTAFAAVSDLDFADSGDLYVADFSLGVVVRVGPDEIAELIVGDPDRSGFSGDGGAAGKASLASPYGVAAGPGRSFYIADTGNHRVRRVAGDGTITTVAGGGNKHLADGIAATNARLGNVKAIDVSPTGRVYFVHNGEVVYELHKDELTRIAGGGLRRAESGIGPKAARFRDIESIAVGPDGTLYIADDELAQVFVLNPDRDGLEVLLTD